MVRYIYTEFKRALKSQYSIKYIYGITAVCILANLAMIAFRDYVYGTNDGIPQESDAYFLPWGWDDEQYVDREPVIYAAVKVHDPSIVADWSSIKDDNGYYPGVRVAAAFAGKTGIAAGMKRPSDLTKGEVAIVFADADRIFEN